MSGNELPLIEEAFKSNYIAPCGPMADRFEREFAAAVGLPYACAVSSGTAALETGTLPKTFRLLTFFTGESDAELVRLAAASKRFLVVSPVPGYAPAGLLAGGFHFVREGVIFRAVANAPRDGTSARP